MHLIKKITKDCPRQNIKNLNKRVKKHLLKKKLIHIFCASHILFFLISANFLPCNTTLKHALWTTLKIHTLFLLSRNKSFHCGLTCSQVFSIFYFLLKNSKLHWIISHVTWQKKMRYKLQVIKRKKSYKKKIKWIY